MRIFALLARLFAARHGVLGVAKFWTALGLMSGTSLDGIDVAVLTTDGERLENFGPARTFPYSEADRDFLRRALRRRGWR